MITTNDAGTATAARMAAMIAVIKRRVRKAPTSAEADAHRDEDRGSFEVNVGASVSRECKKDSQEA
jgi:hypothetical protein